MLLAKAHRSRVELAVLAREWELPLEGVLERLNEATGEHLDMPLFEESEDALTTSMPLPGLCELIVTRSVTLKIAHDRSWPGRPMSDP